MVYVLILFSLNLNNAIAAETQSPDMCVKIAARSRP